MLFSCYLILGASFNNICLTVSFLLGVVFFEDNASLLVLIFFIIFLFEISASPLTLVFRILLIWWGSVL